MRGIEIKDGFRKLGLGAGMTNQVKRHLESSQQSVGQQVPLDQKPAAERRIEIFQTDQQVVGDVLSLEQQRMYLLCLRSPDDGPNVEIDRVPLEPDFVRIDAKRVASGLAEEFPQLANELAQHCARLCFPGLAPEQTNEPLPCFHELLAEREIAENGPQLQALDPNLTSVLLQRKGTEQ